MSGRRKLAAAFVVAVSLLVCFWLGEHNTDLLPVHHLLAAVPAAVILPFLLWRRSRLAGMLASPAIIAAAVAVWMGGAAEGARAFNECVVHGEEVRVLLTQYRAAHGRYPARLSELHARLPGELFFPPHVLHYELTASGYRLGFGDWLVSHEATESDAFMAHK
ncbi:hypothetical protein RugamoR64_47060 [Duganella rhizosphaerae]|uniref:hypothetical protein n=1 Tax=Duganella rhizosphaerae TaxID=2885763 RepID=UPI0030E8A562